MPGQEPAGVRSRPGLGKALGRQTLALFTSYAQLRRTAGATAPALMREGVTVLSQGSAARHQLLETFRGEQHRVAGNAASWALTLSVRRSAHWCSCACRLRCPAIPWWPHAATFDDPFHHYQVPDAILRFRQGRSRLISSKTTVGVVVILDKRATSKGYGHLFPGEPPRAHGAAGSADELAQAARVVDGAGR